MNLADYFKANRPEPKYNFGDRVEPATDTHYVIGYDRACEKMISGIKEHFGVEE